MKAAVARAAMVILRIGNLLFEKPDVITTNSRILCLETRLIADNGSPDPYCRSDEHKNRASFRLAIQLADKRTRLIDQTRIGIRT